MAKEKFKVCMRAYWNKRLSFPNTTLRLSLVAQPLGNESNQITFHNGCPSCHSQLNRVDFCPVCSKQLKGEFESEFGKDKIDGLLANGFLGKSVSSDEAVKIHIVDNDTKLIFTKKELETIKTATDEILAVGYGKVEQINPQHIDSCYALLPNLNDVNDDGDYRRLLYALKMSKMYLVVQYADRGYTKNGVIIAYSDMVTGQEFLMLVNTKESKDLEVAIEYQPQKLTNEQELQMVTQFLTTALPIKDFTKVIENEIEKKKQKLIAMKLAGLPIQIEHKEEKITPNINGFAMAMTQIKQIEEKK
jgi:non-homologous end joining protein Ku